MMKFKTTLLQASTIVVLATTSFQILAENTSTGTAWKPYVGASAGYSRMSAKNQWEETTSLTPNKQIGKNNFNAKGFLAIFHVGVQKPLHTNFRFGAEVYGFLDVGKASVQSLERSESLKRENAAGMKVKFGYLFDTHSFIYVHAGAEKASFKYTATLDGSRGIRKKYLWGMPFGIGVEAALSSNWSSRLEYTHTTYQSWNTEQVIGIYTSKAKISPAQDNIVFGFSYSF